MFVTGKLFQPSLMFAGKAEAYLSEVTLRCSTLGETPGFTHKHQTRLEKLARDKYTTLLQTFINYGQKSFITFGPGSQLMPNYCRRYV